MQRCLTVICAAMLLLLPMACQETEEEPFETMEETAGMPAETIGDPMTEAAGEMPQPEAEAVWSYLQMESYQTWPMWPGKQAFYQGTEPHGALLTTYVNQPALNAIEGGTGPLPADSIIVKENYTPERELAGVTVMYKVEGFNPEHNDWFWLKRSAEGEVEASGQVDSCQSCHAEGDGDYLRTARPGGQTGA